MGKKIYLTIIWLLVLLAIIVGIGVHVFSWFSFDNDEVKGGITETVEVDEFKSIDADLAGVNFEIDNTTDSYAVEYTVKSESRVPQISVEDSTLIIKEKKNTVNLYGTKNKNLSIVVYIPKDVTLDDIVLDVGACDLDFSNINASKLDVDSGAGDIDLADCSIKEVALDAGAGDVDLENVEFSKLDIDAGAGDVDVSGIGDISEYSFDVSVGMGDLTIGGKKMSGMGRDYKATGSTDKAIVIDNGAGDVDVSD